MSNRDEGSYRGDPEKPYDEDVRRRRTIAHSDREQRERSADSEQIARSSDAALPQHSNPESEEIELSHIKDISQSNDDKKEDWPEAEEDGNDNEDEDEDEDEPYEAFVSPVEAPLTATPRPGYTPLSASMSSPLLPIAEPSPQVGDESFSTYPVPTDVVQAQIQATTKTQEAKHTESTGALESTGIIKEGRDRSIHGDRLEVEAEDEDSQGLLFSPRGTTLLRPLPLPLPDTFEPSHVGSTLPKKRIRARNERAVNYIVDEQSASMRPTRRKMSGQIGEQGEEDHMDYLLESSEEKGRALSTSHYNNVAEVSEPLVQPRRSSSISSILAGDGSGKNASLLSQVSDNHPLQPHIRSPSEENRTTMGSALSSSTEQVPSSSTVQETKSREASGSQANATLEVPTNEASNLAQSTNAPLNNLGDTVITLMRSPTPDDQKRIQGWANTAALFAPTLADRAALLYFIQHPEESSNTSPTSLLKSEEKQSSSDITNRDDSVAASPSYLPSRAVSPSLEKAQYRSFGGVRPGNAQAKGSRAAPNLQVIVTGIAPSSYSKTLSQESEQHDGAMRQPNSSRSVEFVGGSGAGTSNQMDEQFPLYASRRAPNALGKQRGMLHTSVSMDHLPTTVSFAVDLPRRDDAPTAPSTPVLSGEGTTKSNVTSPEASRHTTSRFSSPSKGQRIPRERPAYASRFQQNQSGAISSQVPDTIGELTVIPPVDEDSKPISRPVSVHQTPVSSSPSLSSTSPVPASGQFIAPLRMAGAPIFAAIPDTSDGESDMPSGLQSRDNASAAMMFQRPLHPLENPAFDIHPPDPLASDLEYELYNELAADYKAFKERITELYRSRAEQSQLEESQASSVAGVGDQTLSQDLVPDPRGFDTMNFTDEGSASIVNTGTRLRDESSPSIVGGEASSDDEPLVLSRAGSFQSGGTGAGAGTGTVAGSATGSASSSRRESMISPHENHGDPLSRLSAPRPSPSGQIRYHLTLSPSSLRRIMEARNRHKRGENVQREDTSSDRRRGTLLPELFIQPSDASKDSSSDESTETTGEPQLDRTKQSGTSYQVPTARLIWRGADADAEGDVSASESESAIPSIDLVRSFSGQSAASSSGSSATAASRVSKGSLLNLAKYNNPLDVKDPTASQIGGIPHVISNADLHEGLRRLRRNSSNASLAEAAAAAASKHPTASRSQDQNHMQNKALRQPPQRGRQQRSRFDYIPEDDEVSSISSRSRRDSLSSESKDAKGRSYLGDPSDPAVQRQMNARRSLTLGGRRLPSSSPTIAPENDYHPIDQLNLDSTTPSGTLIVPASIQHSGSSDHDRFPRAPAPTPVARGRFDRLSEDQTKGARTSGSLKHSQSLPQLMSVESKSEKQDVVHPIGSSSISRSGNTLQPPLSLSRHGSGEDGKRSPRNDSSVFTFDPSNTKPSPASSVPHGSILSHGRSSIPQPPQSAKYETRPSSPQGMEPHSSSSSFTFGHGSSSRKTNVPVQIASTPVPVAGLSLGDPSSTTPRHIRSIAGNGNRRSRETLYEEHVDTGVRQGLQEFKSRQSSDHRVTSRSSVPVDDEGKAGPSSQSLRLQRRPSSLAQGNVFISEFSFLPQDSLPVRRSREPSAPRRKGRVKPVLAPDAAETAAAAALTALEVKRSRELLEQHAQYPQEPFVPHLVGTSISGQDQNVEGNLFPSSSAHLSNSPNFSPSIQIPGEGDLDTAISLAHSIQPSLTESFPMSSPPFGRRRSLTVSEEMTPPSLPSFDRAITPLASVPTSISTGIDQMDETRFSLVPELADDLVSKLSHYRDQDIQSPREGAGSDRFNQFDYSSDQGSFERGMPEDYRPGLRQTSELDLQQQQREIDLKLAEKKRRLKKYEQYSLRPSATTKEEKTPSVFSWKFWFGIPKAKRPDVAQYSQEQIDSLRDYEEDLPILEERMIERVQPRQPPPERKVLTTRQLDSLPPIDTRIFLGAVNMQLQPQLSTRASKDVKPSKEMSIDSQGNVPDPDELFPILVPKDVTDSNNLAEEPSNKNVFSSRDSSELGSEDEVRAATLQMLQEVLPNATRRGLAKAVRRASSSSLTFVPPSANQAYLSSYFASPEAAAIFAISAEPVQLPDSGILLPPSEVSQVEGHKGDAALRLSESADRQTRKEFEQAERILLGRDGDTIKERILNLRKQAAKHGLVKFRPEPQVDVPSLSSTVEAYTSKPDIQERPRRGKPLSHRVPSKPSAVATEDTPAEEEVSQEEIPSTSVAITPSLPLSSAVPTQQKEREHQQKLVKQRIKQAGEMAVDKRTSELSSIQFVEDAAERELDEVRIQAQREAEKLERGPPEQDEPGPYVSRAPTYFYPPPVASLPKHVSALLNRTSGDYSKLGDVLDVDNPSHIDSIMFHDVDEGLDALQSQEAEDMDSDAEKGDSQSQRGTFSGAVAQFLCGSIAGCVAETMTLPLDVSKVRRQLDTNAPLSAVSETATKKSAHPQITAKQELVPPKQVLTPPPPLPEKQKSAKLKSSGSKGVMDRIAQLERKVDPVSLQTKQATVSPNEISKSSTSSWSKQLSAKTIGERIRSSSFTVATIQDIVKAEGVGGLYKGLPPALLRQFLKAGLQMSLFKEFKQFICTDPLRPTMGEQFGSSVSAAVVGQFIANPADVLKVRLMADGRRIQRGEKPLYKGLFGAATRIFREEGWRGFYQGAVPAMQRSALSSGGGLAIYAHLKTVITDPEGYFKMEQGPTTYLLTSSLSSLLSTFMAAPADTVKTRMMNQGQDEQRYKGFWDCMRQTVRREGVASLFKGMGPNFIRVVPWQMIFYFTYENLTSYVTGSGL